MSLTLRGRMVDDKVAILTDDEEAQKHHHILTEAATNSIASTSTQPLSQDTTPNDDGGEEDPDCFERRCLQINDDLIISKAFYFFYFSAYGSLFPLLPVYYKQLGINASQNGLLVGIRYFIEFCSTPLWGAVADHFKKGKLILLFTLFCWIGFNLGIGFVPPAHVTCVHLIPSVQAPNTSSANTTSVPLPSPRKPVIRSMMDPSRPSKGRNKRAAGSISTVSPTTFPSTLPLTSLSTPLFPLSMNPETSDFGIEANETNMSTTVPLTTPVMNSYEIVYDKQDVDAIFLLILLLVIVGEFFSAPALTIVDTVTLLYLGSHRDQYGRQRMWGSLGWGIFMLAIGLVIDHATDNPSIILETPCILKDWHNYRIAFIAFATLVTMTFAVATQFHFNYQRFENSEATEGIEIPPVDSTAPTAPTDGSSRVQREYGYRDLLKILCNMRYVSVLYVAWFMGFCYGFIFTFLFWHLGDIGGSTTLFGLCSLIDHFSELTAYFLSHYLIGLIGHIRVLYLGLGCNAIRFLYISYLIEPWYVLPLEILQGMTHAAIWASCISYLTAAVPPPLRTSAQGILQGLHLGLGRGCGAVIGGLFVHAFSAVVAFQAIGLISLGTLLIFVGIQCLLGPEKATGGETLVAQPDPPGAPIATIQTVVRHEGGVRERRPLHVPQDLQQLEHNDPSQPAWQSSSSVWVSFTSVFLHLRRVLRQHDELNAETAAPTANSSISPPSTQLEGQPAGE
uniref:Major facilitator superfamily domain containing 6 n=2 Tax=Eptatretus burgeri TaxID=7764 RepID=A0A8C4PXI6_EPTBU